MAATSDQNPLFPSRVVTLLVFLFVWLLLTCNKVRDNSTPEAIGNFYHLLTCIEKFNRTDVYKQSSLFWLPFKIRMSQVFPPKRVNKRYKRSCHLLKSLNSNFGDDLNCFLALSSFSSVVENYFLVTNNKPTLSCLVRQKSVVYARQLIFASRLTQAALGAIKLNTLNLFADWSPVRCRCWNCLRRLLIFINKHSTVNIFWKTELHSQSECQGLHASTQPERQRIHAGQTRRQKRPKRTVSCGAIFVINSVYNHRSRFIFKSRRNAPTNHSFKNFLPWKRAIFGAEKSF